MEATLQIAAGSVIGRLHANAGRNNQDAFDVSVGPEVAVAVVCDGCGSGARSEVGAVLGARLLTAALRTEAAAARREGRTPDLERAREAVLARLRALAD
ncbi:MAG: protein phosphatase 2C domain-containing protein, partial [Myxococcales bacterium]